MAFASSWAFTEQSKESQPAAAILNEKTGTMMWNQREVKETVWGHVIETLTDNAPLDEVAECTEKTQTALARSRILKGFDGPEEEGRGFVDVPREVYDKVVKNMTQKRNVSEVSSRKYVIEEPLYDESDCDSDKTVLQELEFK